MDQVALTPPAYGHRNTVYKRFIDRVPACGADVVLPAYRRAKTLAEGRSLVVPQTARTRSVFQHNQTFRLVFSRFDKLAALSPVDPIDQRLDLDT